MLIGALYKQYVWKIYQNNLNKSNCDPYIHTHTHLRETGGGEREGGMGGTDRQNGNQNVFYINTNSDET